MKRIVLVTVATALVSALSFGAVAFAANGTEGPFAVSLAANPKVTVYDSKDGSTKSFDDIAEALKVANRPESAKITVTLTKGATYEIDNIMRIYSHTEFDLNGATVKRTNAGIDKGMLFNYPIGWDGTKGVARSSAAAGGYNMSTDISVHGGTLDGGNVKKATDASDLVRFDHASDITISDMTIKNVYDCHHIEFVGVTNGKISNCEFSGFEYKNHKVVKENGRESVELDAAWTDNPKNLAKEEGKWASDTYIDGTNDVNCIVENCTFTDLPTCVGEHHYSFGTKYKNSHDIQIVNNTIKASSSVKAPRTAITGGGMDNLTISGNKVTGKYDFAVQAYCGDNIAITDNTFSDMGTNGIMAGHSTVKDKTTNVTIERNTVSNTTQHAISTLNCKVTNISDNTVATTKSKGNGINMKDSTVGVVQNNKVSSIGNNGISFVSGTITNGILNNTVSANVNGIVTSGKIKLVQGNTISSAGKNGISVMSGSVTKGVLDNKISAKSNGIVVTKGKVKLIQKNTVSSAGNNGISVVGGSVGTKGKAATGILKNTVKKAKKGHGITISKGTVANVTSNKVSSPKRNGISVSGSAAVYVIKSNTIVKKADRFGIWLGSTKAKTKVQKNKVTVAAKKFAIGQGPGVSASLSGNKITVK